MDTLLQDLRFGLRRLVKAPGFTAVALLTLGLGIGANSAIFTVVNGVLFRPLPFPEPERLVGLFQMEGDDTDVSSMSPPNFLDVRTRSRSLSDATAYSGTTLTLTERGDPVRLDGTTVTGSFFDVLGVPPLFGRGFRMADNEPGQHRKVVLSYPLWRDRFARNPQVVGQPIILNGEPHEVIGIMPEHFAYPEGSRLWVPAQFNEAYRVTNRAAWYLRAVGRLAPGQTAETARREIETIGQQLEKEYPAKNTRVRITLRPLQAHAVRGVRTALLVLLGAVCFVLLIACANVANLCLARAVRQEGEMAIRTALGGNRVRLIRQVLTESLVLAIGGGAVGLMLALWGTDVLVSLKPGGIPRLDDVRLDPSVLLFTGAVTLLTGILFGSMPAWQATRVDLVTPLKDSGRGAVGGGRVRRLRGALVVAEMALAVLLLTGAGLLIRSFVALQRVDAGFKIEDVLTFSLTLPERTYPTDEKRALFMNGLFERLRGTPGVASVAAVSQPPVSGARFNITYYVKGRPQAKPGEGRAVEVRVVTPDYFRTLGIPVRRGRTFTESDVDGAQPVVLLSERAAREIFPTEDPIGQHIDIGWGRGKGPGHRVGGDVVGIVADIREAGLSEPGLAQLYVPYGQAPERSMTLLLDTKVPPMTLASVVRQHVAASDRELAISHLQTMEEILSESVSQSRFYTLLLGVFATVALLLAAIGIFGVMSHAVAYRTREIGIRLALGAQGRDVRRLVLGEAIVLSGLGIVIGLAAAIPLTRLLGTLLFELTPGDPVTLGSVAVVLLGVALGASYLPAWRASRVDPLAALRME